MKRRRSKPGKNPGGKKPSPAEVVANIAKARARIGRPFTAGEWRLYDRAGLDLSDVWSLKSRKAKKGKGNEKKR